MFDISKSKEDGKYIVIANIGIGEIYLKRSLTDKALKKAKEAIKISKEIDYPVGIVKSRILYNKILLNHGKFDRIQKI